MVGLRGLAAAAVAAAAVGVAGCGGGGGIHPVRGKVVFADGSPAAALDGFTVVFEGTAPDGKSYSASGTIDAEGRFELSTNKPGDGAPAGTCKVLIEPRMLDSEREAPYPVHPKYRTFETSGLTVEVGAKSNDVTLTVEPRPKGDGRPKGKGDGKKG